MESFEEAVRDELDGRRLPSWREPFHWWGPAWCRPRRRGLGDLVEDGVLDLEVADSLRRAVQGGESVVVAAEPSRVGKSTLADALVQELPAGAERVYIRGCYETFGFVDDAGATRTALLVNEISPHLPTYLWGAAARRLLQLARDGAQVIGTIHAATPGEVVYQLSRQPVGATPDEIAALGTLVLLGPPTADGNGRWRVRRIVGLRAMGQGIRVEEIAYPFG